MKLILQAMGQSTNIPNNCSGGAGPSPSPGTSPSPSPGTTPSPSPSGPSKQLWSTCSNCANLNTNKLVAQSDTAYQNTTWADVYGCKDPDKCYFSALDMAKTWIVATDGMEGPSGSGPTGRGGCASCMSAVAVGLAEGGNQVGPGGVTDSAGQNYNVPKNMYDPTFSTAICKGDPRCMNGGPWQVSSAYDRSGKCGVDCKVANCTSLRNPLCSAKIAMAHAQGSPNNYACPPNSPTCSLQDMQKGIDPNCNFGPFGLCSAGWNSPSCSHLYRRTDPTAGYNTYGRMAINACQQAQKELTAAGWKPKSGSCDVNDPVVIKSQQNIPAGSGDWTLPTTQGGKCQCGSSPCL